MEEAKNMILEVRVDNCQVFSKSIELSLKADMRNKKLAYNVVSNKNFNILKSVCLYGPNNVGKTCLINAIRFIRRVMLNKRPVGINTNLFTKNKICKLGMTFMYNEQVFNFDFHYNSDKEEFLYEKFSECVKDKYGNEKEIIYLEKDPANKRIFAQNNTDLEAVLGVVGKDNIAIYLIDTEKFPQLNTISKILQSFASKIDILDMNKIPWVKTIEVMKSKSAKKKKIVEFIRHADIDLEDFKYSRDFLHHIGLKFHGDKSAIQEEVLKHSPNFMDQLCLVSTHNGVQVPSAFFDSTGTKKIIALASHIIDAIEEGKVLVIDELDSSLHYSLTRAIVALFNNELNKNGQLIFSTHDISLLDCKALFRKEQIWFMRRTDEQIDVYPLSIFTAQKNGTRDTTDIIEHYKKGVYGALPRPDLIEALLEVEK